MTPPVSLNDVFPRKFACPLHAPISCCRIGSACQRLPLPLSASRDHISQRLWRLSAPRLALVGIACTDSVVSSHSAYLSRHTTLPAPPSLSRHCQCSHQALPLLICRRHACHQLVGSSGSLPLTSS